jgi:hypothetical protein
MNEYFQLIAPQNFRFSDGSSVELTTGVAFR